MWKKGQGSSRAVTGGTGVNGLTQKWISYNSSIAIASQVEVARAKKQLQSMLMMNLESRVIVFEDIGR